VHCHCGFTASGENALFCHSERSEESLFDLNIRKKQGEILRFTQNDGVLSFSAAYLAAGLVNNCSATPTALPVARGE
jgi:hypothetical protein